MKVPWQVKMIGFSRAIFVNTLWVLNENSIYHGGNKDCVSSVRQEKLAD